MFAERESSIFTLTSNNFCILTPILTLRMIILIAHKMGRFALPTNGYKCMRCLKLLLHALYRTSCLRTSVKLNLLGVSTFTVMLIIIFQGAHRIFYFFADSWIPDVSMGRAFG